MTYCTHHGSPGLVLYSERVQSMIGYADKGVQTSGLVRQKFAESGFDGRVYVPGGCTFAYKLAREIFCNNGEPVFYGFSLSDEFRNVRGRYRETLTRVLKELDELSEYLDMPVLKTYSADIKERAQQYYIESLETNIKKTFSSGKLRGQKKFAEALQELLQEIKELFHQMVLPENYLETTIQRVNEARSAGIEQRRVKHAERKRIREESSHTQKKRSKRSRVAPVGLGCQHEGLITEGEHNIRQF